MEYLEFIMQIKEWLSPLRGPVGRHLGYMVHYKRNIVSFNADVDKLEAMQNDNQVSVNSALMNGDVIKSVVKKWLEGADEAITNAKKLNAEVEANKKCCSGCCPDLIARYRLSKKAVKDKEAMQELQAEAGRFGKVSLEPRQALGIESIMSTAYFEAFKSTKEAMHEAMEALKDDKVTIIGVYGMGGVGKTTMVDRVAKQAHQDGLFGFVVKAVVSQTPNLTKIQGQLADMLGLKLLEETEMGRAGRLKEGIMRGKRILIILDDVWKGIELSTIGIPNGSELEESKSKVLLTTRLENVCHVMESQAKILLNVLSEQDSWILFTKKVGRLVESTEFNDVARKVARECGGLPVALIAVAGALGDKDLEEWKEAARRLQMSRTPNLEDDGGVFKCLKLSYDYLRNDDTKSCFLLCCLFPEDHDIHIEDLVKYGIGRGFFQDANTMEEAKGQARSVARHLKASSLLLESEQEGCVRMHDVIRDTAIKIASSGEGHAFLVQAGLALKDWPKGKYERYTTISLMWNEIAKIPEELVCPKLQTLLLQNNSDLEEIPDTFIQSLNALRVLDMSGTNILSLPPSLNLLTNLQTLNLDRCQSITDVSILGELKKLEILSLQESSLEGLPEEIGQLTSLRMLDITMSSDIKTIPSKVISRLSQLEELYMQGSFGDWGHEVEGNGEEFNASFDELTCLSYLNILKVDITDVECMPKSVRFEPNWVKFDVCISTDLSIRFMNVHLAKVIALHSSALVLDTTINTLPEWFNNVVTRRAETLFYRTCRGLQNILVEYDQGRLNGVKSILVENCYGIVSLMNAVTWVPSKPMFESLVELRVHYMDYLKELCVGQLPEGSLSNLKFLEVQQCFDLVNALLSSNLLQRLQSLEILDVSVNSIGEVFRSEALEEGQVVIRNLREMKLDNLPELTNIWNGPAQLAVFHKLKILTVIKCKRLRNLFTREVSQCLLQLEVLWLESCHSLEGIIGTNEGESAQSRKNEIVEKHEEEAMNKITFPQLKNVLLQDLPQLKSFYSGSALVECPSLEHLCLQDCPMFRTSASDFHSRKQVQVNNEQYFLLLKKRPIWKVSSLAALA